MIRFNLDVAPLPLSQCFDNAGKSRIASPAYTKWKREAGWLMAAHGARVCGRPGKPTFAGRVGIHIAVRDDGRRSDLDNKLKCLCDLLVDHYVITDDSVIDDLRITRMRGENVPLVSVEVFQQ